MPDDLTVATADGVTLEAELDVPASASAAAVLTHPHPAYGGDMRSLVTGALFAALPRAGVAALRFNFRGVGRSGGVQSGGPDERLDVLAAIDGLASRVDQAVPIVLVGYSFGADVAASVVTDRLAGWVLVAPPLRLFAAAEFAARTDSRPKLVLAPQHDSFSPPARTRAHTEGWTATTVEEIPGADHFLVGATDAVVEAAVAFIHQLRESRPQSE